MATKLNKKIQQLPIETEAYKREQAIASRLAAGEVITNPKDFPKGTPKDVVAVSSGRAVSTGGKKAALKLTKENEMTKLPAAKAKNSKTTATVSNPRKAAAASAKPAKKAAAKSNGGGRGRASVYSGKRIIPLVKENPRREGTAGHKFMAVVLKAGKKGIPYEELRSNPAFGNNHLAYDIEHGNVSAK